MKCKECSTEGKQIRGLCLRCYRKLYKREQRNNPQVRESRRIQDRQRYKDCREELNEYRRLRLQNLKQRVIKLLGGKCNWPNCSWDDERALQIDHVNDDGNQERRERGKEQPTFYLRILKSSNPRETYQVLCANHNWVKRCEAEEKKFFGV